MSQIHYNNASKKSYTLVQTCRVEIVSCTFKRHRELKAVQEKQGRKGKLIVQR